MGNWARNLKRVAIAIYLVGLHFLLGYLLIDKYVLRNLFIDTWTPENVSTTQIEPTPIPTPQPETSPVPLPATPSEQYEMPAAINLIIPVQGVTRDKLIDTFSEARSEGRVHDAIDIPAPLDTPVLAAADGEILKFHDSIQGGTTIYQISADRKYFFYYAHLERRADGLAEKQFVKRGTTIGYVGNTGNAGPGNYHLHFAISAVIDEKRFWEGISLNPYNVLTGRAELR